MQNRIDEIFWGQTFKNTPYFNVRAPDFWKPLTSDYVAQGCFFPETKPQISCVAVAVAGLSVSPGYPPVAMYAGW